MGGYLERVDYCLRVGKECNKEEDPYTWACSIKNHKNGEIAEVKGVDKKLTREERIDIRETLKRYGYRKAFYIRIKNDKKIVHNLIR